MEEKLNKVKPVKVKTPEDLARLLGTFVAFGRGVYVIRFECNNKYYCGVLSVIKDYYKLYGLPLFYYTECENKGKYLVLRKDSSGKEVFEYGEEIRTNALCIPIVDLSEVPDFIEVEGC